MKLKEPSKIAIVYHYIAHYRLPIFRQLMRIKNLEYIIFSDSESGNNIETVDPELSRTPIKDGGLRWTFVQNKWLFKGYFLWQFGLLSKLMDKNFNGYIFLGNIYYITTWVALVLLKLKRKKIYLWTHGVTSNEKGLKWSIRKLFYGLSDGVLLYGNEARNIMIKNGFPESKLHVIYNSLDYEKQLKYRKDINSNNAGEIRKKLFKYPEHPLIVFVGRLSFSKKLDMIVEASRLLQNENFKINILFIGEGNSQGILNKLVKNYNLRHYVHFYGACYDESKLALLIGASDLCVSPGEVGLTAITALGYGTPVITHDDFNFQMPEYEAIIPGKNGDLFQRDSVEDLVCKIKKWLVEHKGETREFTRKKCYEIVDQKYNPIQQAEIINKIVLER